MEMLNETSREASTAVTIEVVGAGHWRARTGDLALDVRRTNGEPRIRDLDGAAFLGYEDAHKIRDLIRRLVQRGMLGKVFSATTAESALGRPGTEYWLTRRQLLLVATQSETPRAWALTEALIDLCLRVLDGERPPPPARDALAEAQAAALPGLLALCAAQHAALQRPASPPPAPSPVALPARLESALPDGAMTLAEVATKFGWYSNAGKPHIQAVAGAMRYHQFREPEEWYLRPVPGHHPGSTEPDPAYVVTAAGVARFREIDADDLPSGKLRLEFDRKYTVVRKKEPSRGPRRESE